LIVISLLKPAPGNSTTSLPPAEGQFNEFPFPECFDENSVHILLRCYSGSNFVGIPIRIIEEIFKYSMQGSAEWSQKVQFQAICIWRLMQF
jgi:hypothetical protein